MRELFGFPDSLAHQEGFWIAHILHQLPEVLILEPLGTHKGHPYRLNCVGVPFVGT
jgi:hypothetical protein